jgi:antitoxin (DNA-binding transcriptional repressor) of toxin-antitoxin stability system
LSFGSTNHFQDTSEGNYLVILATLATIEHNGGMKTVNIGELKNQLSGNLQYVRNGEEIVIRDRSVPVARILPFLHGSGWEQEAQLVASGAMKMPEEEMDWELFFGERTGNVSHEAAVQAAIDSRGDR